jgi:hypothetical protein
MNVLERRVEALESALERRDHFRGGSPQVPDRDQMPAVRKEAGPDESPVIKVGGSL